MTSSVLHSYGEESSGSFRVRLNESLGLEVAASEVKGRRLSQQDSYFAFVRDGFGLLGVCDGVGGGRGGDIAAKFGQFIFEAYCCDTYASLSSLSFRVAKYVLENQDRVQNMFVFSPVFTSSTGLAYLLSKAYYSRSLKNLCDEVFHPFLRSLNRKCASTVALVEFKTFDGLPVAIEYWQGDSLIVSGRSEDCQHSWIDSPAYDGDLDSYLVDPASNKIWACLGSGGPIKDRKEVIRRDLSPGDLYILCTDGVNARGHSFVDVYKTVRQGLKQGASLEVALEKAMQRAVQLAAYDNTTIVAAQVVSI